MVLIFHDSKTGIRVALDVRKIDVVVENTVQDKVATIIFVEGEKPLCVSETFEEVINMMNNAGKRK